MSQATQAVGSTTTGPANTSKDSPLNQSPGRSEQRTDEIGQPENIDRREKCDHQRYDPDHKHGQAAELQHSLFIDSIVAEQVIADAESHQ